MNEFQNLGFATSPYTLAGITETYTGKLTITHLSMYTTRHDYKAPYQRTYSINATAGVVNKFQNIVQERGTNTRLNPIAVSSLIPEITTISTLPTGQAGIVNGWDTERFRFIMVVEANTMNGTKRISFIQGFTEFSDATASGLIDPNMVFYINSVTNVQQTIDTVNNRILSVPTSTFNVITDMFGNARYQQVDPYSLPKLVRPRDIVENTMSLSSHDTQAGRIVNASGTLGQNKPIASNRVNNDPLQYFSKLYNSFVQGKNATLGSAADIVEVLENTCDIHEILEPSISAQPFFDAIHKITGEIVPSSFTMNILLALDPNVTNLPPQIFYRDNNGINMGPQNLPDLMDSSDTADTLNPTAENLKAVTICNSLNGMMLECLITRLSVSMTNSFGENAVIISDVNSFIPNVDLIMWTNKLRDRIENILFPNITDNGLTRVDVHAMTDVMKETTISISINGGPQYLYRFPTFADSLYTPVVTDTDNKDMLTEGFTTLAEVSYI